jgi:hypothetical protein
MAASDMLIEIYMAESTILRTEKLAKNQGDKVQEQIAMAKLYLYQAVDIVTQKGKALFLLWKVMNNNDVNGFKTFH